MDDSEGRRISAFLSLLDMQQVIHYNKFIIFVEGMLTA